VWLAGVTKTVLANGWYFDNSKLGFPTGSNLRDFPNIDVWHGLYLNAFSLISHDWALAMNSLYVGSFLLIAAAAFCALRGLRVRIPIAAGGAVITAFLPYHLVRNEAHLTLADYFVVPLIVMLAVVQLSDRPWFRLRGGWQSSRARWLAAIAIAVLAGGTARYYSVMGAALLLLPALFASLVRRRVEPAVSALVLVGILGVLFGAQLVPTILNNHEHGKNTAFDRPLDDQDRYSLRPLLLLAPRDDHRIAGLSSIAERYNKTTRPSENGEAVGLIAALGLVGLFGAAAAPLVGRPGLRHSYDRGLALVAATAILLGITAGGGELFAMFGLTEIRAWNRITPFIGFAGISAAARFLDRLLARRNAPRHWIVIIVAVCTILAIFDQTSADDVPKYDATAAQFEREQAFVHGIENAVGDRAAILQLPYAGFPEFGTLVRMPDYSQLRGWLYSDTLRWSFGAIRGRPNWQDGQRALSIPDQLRRARAAGFSAVWVDRRGFVDSGAAVEKKLRACLGDPILVESDNFRVLYDLRAPPHC
jgi:phosphoglycerol transferase